MPRRPRMTDAASRDPERPARLQRDTTADDPDRREAQAGEAFVFARAGRHAADAPAQGNAAPDRGLPSDRLRTAGGPGCANGQAYRKTLGRAASPQAPGRRPSLRRPGRRAVPKSSVPRERRPAGHPCGAAPSAPPPPSMPGLPPRQRRGGEGFAAAVCRPSAATGLALRPRAPGAPPDLPADVAAEAVSQRHLGTIRPRLPKQRRSVSHARLAPATTGFPRAGARADPARRPPDGNGRPWLRVGDGPSPLGSSRPGTPGPRTGASVIGRPGR